MHEQSLGAVPVGDRRVRFTVWAPHAGSLEVHLTEPHERTFALERGPHGVWSGTVDDVGTGARYRFRIDGRLERPDPASRYQPEGVHGPSEVVDPGFEWSDEGFRAVGLDASVFYEMHVGAFTEEGTFEAAIGHLDRLCELGVTTVELMPVAQFPGARNWGYDGVYPWAVQNSYGGPRGLARLVDACHRRGLSVVLDVVYNHLGPEGNYLADYAPYFNERYHTPWGAALNFDGAWSDQVRRYFIGSALYLADVLHIDGFRIDAIHSIFDMSARPFLQELTAELHAFASRTGRRIDVIAESDLNDARVLAPREIGGLGMDAQWSDDFHHAVQAYTTGDAAGYYADFGRLDDVARALRQGYLYTGQYSRFRNRRHGNSPHGLHGSRFVVCTQNHDQVGNRARGDRPAEALTPAQLRLRACLLMLSPWVPMLFMGQEYGETAPFQYFTSHGDPELGEAVRRGRRAEFADFGWEPEQIPDPQDERTFVRSQLDRGLLDRPENRGLWALYRRLIGLRRELPALRAMDPGQVESTAYPDRNAVTVRRRSGDDKVVCAFAFDRGSEGGVPLPVGAGSWRKVLDSDEETFGGAGGSAPGEIQAQGPVSIEQAPFSGVLYVSSR